jgi:hypothetical protein
MVTLALSKDSIIKKVLAEQVIFKEAKKYIRYWRYDFGRKVG